jgi:hypothetical protein
MLKSVNNDSQAVDFTEEDATHEFLRVSEFMLSRSGDVLQLKTIPNDLDKFCETVPVRFMRRRVAPDEREFIWNSTNGQCYLCKQSVPKLSSWHVEHVVAFSENPLLNDVLGNMLPSCASCNLRKHSKDLLECITTDLTYDLSTASKDVAHLNTAARTKIVMALKVKHNRQQAIIDGTDDRISGDKTGKRFQKMDAILSEIEQAVVEQTALHSSSLHTSSTSSSPWSEIENTRIDRADLLFDESLAESDAISSGAFGEIHMGKFDLTAHNRKTKLRQQRLMEVDGDDTTRTPTKASKSRPSLGGAQFSTLTQAVVAITGSTPEKGSTFLANR